MHVATFTGVWLLGQSPEFVTRPGRRETESLSGVAHHEGDSEPQLVAVSRERRALSRIVAAQGSFLIAQGYQLGLTVSLAMAVVEHVPDQA